MRPLILIFTSILFIFGTSIHAHALSCRSQDTEELIQDSDIIFLGVAVSSKTPLFKNDKNTPDSYTRFKISKIYKGDLNNIVDIYHSKKDTWPVQYEEGTEYVIFASQAPNTDLYVTGPCTPRLTSNNLQSHDPESRPLEGAARRWATLEIQKGKLDAIDTLIQRFPDNAWLYIQKGEFLEEFGDYHRAVSAYKTALDKEPNWKDVTSKVNFQKAYLGYGKALFHSKQYQEALPYLKKTADEEFRILNYQAKLREEKGSEYVEPNYDYVRGATKLYAANLIYLGDSEALKEIKADVSGMTFEDMTFSNLSLNEANFSDTKLYRVTIENTSFQGANFSNAKLNGREVKNSDFSNTNFLNASVSGGFENTNFVNANFTGANLGGYLFKTVDFSNAHFENSIVRANHMKVPVEHVNFTKAQFINSEIMYLDGETVKYEGATYNCGTIFPKDFLPTGHGMTATQEACSSDEN